MLLREGVTVFVEVKTAGGRISRIQDYQHRRLESLGFAVFVVWNKVEVDVLLATLSTPRG